MRFFKNINLINALVFTMIIFNIYAYAQGRISLSPLLLVGAMQIILLGYIHYFYDEMKHQQEEE